MQQTLFLVKNKRYSPHELLSDLLGHYKASKGHLIRNGFEWICELTPTEFSSTYTVKILYQLRGTSVPLQVFVISPKPLQLAKGATRLPHTYDTQKQRLCLYKPGWNEWDKSKLMSSTIVHWISLWLMYYEHWVHTGIWIGGGHGNWDAIPIDGPTNSE